MSTPGEIVDLALSRGTTLGRGRLVAIDGPSASGKTTLATAVAAAAPPHLSVALVHLEDLYDGWSALDTIEATLERLLRPLADDRPAHLTAWDWDAEGPGAPVTVAPADLLVLEGVGAGHRSIEGLTTVLVWCTDRGDAVERAHARDLALHPSAAADPAAYRRRLEEWQQAQLRHYAMDATEERADVALG